jgi:hypothetical protein
MIQPTKDELRRTIRELRDEQHRLEGDLASERRRRELSEQRLRVAAERIGMAVIEAAADENGATPKLLSAFGFRRRLLPSP